MLGDAVRSQDSGCICCSERGANINAKDKDGKTVLMLAIRCGETDIAKLLIEKGVNINAKDNKYGDTALMIASLRGDTDIVKLLLDKGADVNMKATKENCKSPIFMAVELANLEMINTLLNAGADLNLYDKHGSTVLHDPPAPAELAVDLLACLLLWRPRGHD